MNRSIKPGDDFYRYANGGWLGSVSIPAGQASYDTRAMLMEKTSERVRDLIQQAATSHSTKGSIAQRSATIMPALWTRPALKPTA